MDDRINVFIAKINVDSQVKSDKKFAVIVHNSETGESKVAFFADAETAKQMYFFTINAVRISGEVFC